MAKKFLAVIAGIAAVMAAVAIFSALLNLEQAITLDYVRESIERTDSGSYSVVGRETLHVGADGSATYDRFDGSGNRLEFKSFAASRDEVKVLRELFLATGFMQIPATQYVEKSGVANYTKYELAVQSGAESKSIRWVNPEAAQTPVPSIIVNTGTRLDAMIARNT